MNTKKLIKQANKNGKKLGFWLGYKDGYQYAFIQLAEELEAMAKHKREEAKKYKPVDRVCWNCASGLTREVKHKTDGTPCWCNPRVVKVKGKNQ